jgi:hypothetical protein
VPLAPYTALAEAAFKANDLSRLWNTPEANALGREIFDYQCPQGWTPCEAYQSIMGNFVARGRRARDSRPAA